MGEGTETALIGVAAGGVDDDQFGLGALLREGDPVRPVTAADVK